MIVKAESNFIVNTQSSGTMLQKVKYPCFPVVYILERPQCKSIKIRVNYPTAEEFSRLRKWLVDVENSIKK